MTAFLLRYWKQAGIVLILAGALGFHYWAVWQAGKAGRVRGAAEVRAEWKAAEAAAEARHAARLEEINRDHQSREAALRADRDRLLATPVVRTIRVPVASVCPRPSPSDASLPPAGTPAGEHVDVVDEGYPAFRDFLIRYAAGTDLGSGGASAVPDRGEGSVAAVSDLF